MNTSDHDLRLQYYATLTDAQMATVLHGYFADYNRVNVPFPGDGNAFAYSISEGAKALRAEVDKTSGRITIGGASEGAPVVFEVLRQLQADPNRPSREQLDAVVYGAPGPVFYTFGPPYRPLPVTQYDLTVVIAEYDGIADAPDNWLNLLAVANAIMGAKQFHTSAPSPRICRRCRHKTSRSSRTPRAAPRQPMWFRQRSSPCCNH